MDYHWTPLLVWNLIIIFPIVIAAIISIRNTIQTQYTHSYLLSVMWVLISLNFFFVWFGKLTQSIPIYILGMLFWVAFGFFNVLLVDTLSRDSVDWKKMTIITAVSAAVVLLIFSLDLDTLLKMIREARETINSSIFIQWNNAWTLLTAVNTIFWVYYVVKIYLHAPVQIRKWAALNLVGASFMSIVTVIVMLLEIPLYELVGGLGAIIVTIAFAKCPRMAGILPSKALRLSVIHRDSGIPLYTHTWTHGEDLGDEDLFSGMFHGIRLIMEEQVQRGEVLEIRLEQAVLIVTTTPKANIVSVIVVTKTSKALKKSLAIFQRKFASQYSSTIKDPMVAGPFEGVENLVRETFDLVPEY